MDTAQALPLGIHSWDIVSSRTSKHSISCNCSDLGLLEEMKCWLLLCLGDGLGCYTHLICVNLFSLDQLFLKWNVSGSKWAEDVTRRRICVEIPDSLGYASLLCITLLLFRRTHSCGSTGSPKGHHASRENTASNPRQLWLHLILQLVVAPSQNLWIKS